MLAVVSVQHKGSDVGGVSLLPQFAQGANLVVAEVMLKETL